jgi:hypothetical protein
MCFREDRLSFFFFNFAADSDVLRRGIDPRFNPLSGKFNEDLFRKSYAFLDDLKREEVQRLREELQEATSEERRDMIRRAIQIQVLRSAR